MAADNEHAPDWANIARRIGLVMSPAKELSARYLGLYSCHHCECPPIPILINQANETHCGCEDGIVDLYPEEPSVVLDLEEGVVTKGEIDQDALNGIRSDIRDYGFLVRRQNPDGKIVYGRSVRDIPDDFWEKLEASMTAGNA